MTLKDNEVPLTAFAVNRDPERVSILVDYEYEQVRLLCKVVIPVHVGEVEERIWVGLDELGFQYGNKT